MSRHISVSDVAPHHTRPDAVEPASSAGACYCCLVGSPWQRLYLRPEPHGQGWLREGPPDLTSPVSGSGAAGPDEVDPPPEYDRLVGWSGRPNESGSFAAGCG